MLPILNKRSQSTIQMYVQIFHSRYEKFKFTRIYSVSIWGARQWSQYGHITDSNILTVVRMKSPEWRITQSHIRYLNVSWPHKLHKWTPRIIQKILSVLSPPCLALSVDRTIVSCLVNTIMSYHGWTIVITKIIPSEKLSEKHKIIEKI